MVVEGGQVVRVGRDAAEGLPLDSEQVTVVDAKGLWVVPGLVDIHVHMREPGQEYKEDIASGLRAAAAGGFTTVCPMANTKPVNDNRAITEMMMAKAKEVGDGIRLFPFGAATMGLKGEQLAEMADMRDAGAIGVSDDGRCIMNAAVMRRVLEYAKTFDLLVSQHAEDHHLTDGAQMNEGPVATRLGLKGWPREAEDIIVARDIILAEGVGTRYHVAHISTMGAVRWVREAKARGLKVTCEVTPHHLTMTDESLITYDTHCKVNPPLRTEEDVEAMVAALADGTIDCVATDHAPHSTLEKNCEFAEAAVGINGLETAVPTLLRLVDRGALSPLRMVEAMSTGACKVVPEIDGGTLKPGARADITLIHPNLEWTISREALRSRSFNTPLLDQTVKGAVVKTIAAGRVVYERPV